jgi:hypothetical protein
MRDRKPLVPIRPYFQVQPEWKIPPKLSRLLPFPPRFFVILLLLPIALSLVNPIPCPHHLFIEMALSADDMIFGFNRDKYCIFNTTILNHRVQTFQMSGISHVRHEPEVILSLTSFPARIADITTCLYTLFTQSFKVDRIVLWLSVAEFTNSSVPESVLKWQSYGLTISWVDEDLKEYLKLIPALKEFPDSIIITVDDDALYPSYIVERLVFSYLANPSAVHAHRACKVALVGDSVRYIGFNGGNLGTVSVTDHLLVAEGIGGVLFPPRIFPVEVFNRSAFERMAPYHDDIWFFAMRTLVGVPVRVPQDSDSRYCRAPRNSLLRSPELSTRNWQMGLNHRQVSAVANAYGIAKILRTLERSAGEKV